MLAFLRKRAHQLRCDDTGSRVLQAALSLRVCPGFVCLLWLAFSLVTHHSLFFHLSLWLHIERRAGCWFIGSISGTFSASFKYLPLMNTGDGAVGYHQIACCSDMEMQLQPVWYCRSHSHLSSGEFLGLLQPYLPSLHSGSCSCV